MTATRAADYLCVTAEGHERLRRELETLRGEGRRATSERLGEARADGHFEDGRVARPRGELRLEVVDITGGERRARKAA